MKIQIKEVVNNVENIKALQEVSLPIKVSYKIKRLVDKLNPIVKSYEEKRTDLVKEFGEKQEDESVSVTDPEKLKLFVEKLNELLAIEEELDFEPIKLEELGEISIAPKDLVDFIFEA